MRVPLSWLKEYVDIDIPVVELAHKLTLAGLEVSDMQIMGGSWDRVFVAKILAVNPHPNADRLRLATVDLGDRQMTVVCGAPNLVVGDKVAFAMVGAKLIDGHTGKLEELKPAKIRGIVSEGMICSEKELGISDSHEGILVLDPKYEIGRPLADCLSDVVFEIEVTPNRADCLSVTGIAREIAALTGKNFKMPDLSYSEADEPVETKASVEILAPDSCHRYCATVIEGVKIGPSPKWMQDRLAVCGMRPISNIVDVTNYVMLELGQPLHSFDYKQIRGNKIIVRHAVEGETMYTLDETERKFSADILLIADAERPVAVAGIMGGLSSEVREYTTSILLESANFNQAIIHRGALNLKLSSEASARFEKGLNPELSLVAAKRATKLIAELAGGRVARGIIDVYPGRTEQKTVHIKAGDVKRLTGMDIRIERVEECMSALGFIYEKTGDETICVKRPWWRSDINCTADLVEEVARITGYENMPTSMLSSSLPTGEGNRLPAFRQNLRESMVSLGFQEIITYPLTSIETLKKTSYSGELAVENPLRLENPMSRELEFLRTNIRMGVLSVMARNQRNREYNIRLFEIGKAFIPRQRDLPKENEVLCALIDSVVPQICWQTKAKVNDFYSAKGMVEALLARYGLCAEYKPSEDMSLNPSKCADILIDKVKIGVVGEVHPRVMANFDIEEPVFLFEIDLERLFSFSSKMIVYKPPSRYPGVIRDLALLVNEDIKYDSLLAIFKKFDLISEVRLFDLYVGEQIPAGKKSMAFRLTYQSYDHTLKDEEIEGVQKQILEVLYKETGAVLRS